MAAITKIIPRSINTTGNYVVNSIDVSANVVAGNLKTDHLLYSNGSPYVFTTNAAGSNTQIQFNDSNSFAGSSNLTFNTTTNTLSVDNIQVTGNITPTANVTYDLGNSTNRFKDLYLSGNTLQIGDGAITIDGNSMVLTNPLGGTFVVDGSNAAYASLAAYVTEGNQSNITQVGTLVSLDVLTSITTANIKTDYLLHANGNAYVVSDFTNDAGYLVAANLSSYATESYVSNSIANLVASAPAALDTLNELANALGNDASFSTSVTNSLANKLNSNAFTWANISGKPTLGNISSLDLDGNSSNILYGNGVFSSAPTTSYGDTDVVSLLSNFGSNTITTTGDISVGNVSATSFTTSGSGGNISGADYVIANYFSGSGNNLSNIQVANVTGLGNLATVNKDGNSSNILYGNGVFASSPVNYNNSNVATFLASFGSNSISTTGNVAAGNFVGNGQALTSLPGANVTGTVANATYATTSGSASGVTSNAQPNITSVGILSSLEVSGNTVIGGNLIVNGTTTSINSIVIQIDDLAIVLANDASSSSQANGAGVIINGANANMLYINSTNSFTFSHKISADGSLLSNITGANVTGIVANSNVANIAYSVDGSNVSGEVSYANVANSIAVANVTGIGNIATLDIDGNASNILYGNGVFAGAPVTYGDSNVESYLPTYSGNLSPGNLEVTTFANLGDVANIYISGGTSGQYLKTDGSGNLSWDTVSGGSSGSQSYITATIDSFTGDGVTTDFTLSIVPGDISQTLVNYNGAMQLRSAYTLTADVISFSEAPASGSTIEVTTTSGLTSAGGSFVYRQYTGDGSTATFTVSSACDANTVLVTLNGVLQAPTLDYTVTNGTLTFLTAPLNNERIQVRELKSAIATATISTGGSNTQVQFNDAGILGGSSGFTYNKTTQLLNIGNLAVTGKANLNSVSNITITGGTSGQYLQTDGAGNVSWANVTSGLSNARSFGFSLVFGG